MSIQDLRTGVLLINLGSPSELSPASIRQFLQQFLMDPRVIDLPWALRAMIVYGLVSPFRPKMLIPQYESIWLAEGSPLLVYSRQLTDCLQQALGDNVPVALGMRYGSPSMASALESLLQQSLDKIIVIPLYPQYASSTTGSTQAELFRLLSDYISVPAIEIIPPFYAQKGFLSAQSALYKQALVEFDAEHVVMSYHGLPVSHIRNDERHHIEVCEQTGVCPPMNIDNTYCYRAQCYATSRGIASELGWSNTFYTTAFQSRFGKSKWIEPVTTDVMERLVGHGIKRLAIATPAFVIDCLESLEEIAVRANEDWQKFGGQEMRLLPCLNSNIQWVSVLANWVKSRIDTPGQVM